MPKKKLRSCTRCGVRHGPPIGNRCKRAVQEFEELNEEMGSGRAAASTDGSNIHPQEDAGEEAIKGASLVAENEDPSMLQLPREQEDLSFSEFRRRREEERRFAGRREQTPPEQPLEPNSEGAGREKGGGQGITNSAHQPHSQGVYCHVPWDQYPQHLRGHHQYLPMFRVGTQPSAADVNWGGQEPNPENRRPIPGNSTDYHLDYHMDYRMSRLEKSLADMADTQKVLLQFQTEALTRAQPAAMSQEPNRASTKREDSSDSESEPETESWKESFSDDLWKNVKGKRDKNPFEQSSYLKKGETVSSFEKVMEVIFKTISQLVEVNGDIRGVVRHGLAMAEKASKGIYKIEAFTKYDESVRDRAGNVGPSAFGTVDQEDTLRFFSYDNVERTKGWKSTSGTSGPSKKKSEKMCLKYNDQGCNSKSCPYSHSCAACEEVGHSRKDCKNLKKKEK